MYSNIGSPSESSGKQFRAAVYGSPDELAAEIKGLPKDTQVITSSVVRFVAEARCFVLDGQVVSCAVYEGDGDEARAAQCARRVASVVELPRSCVLDVGLLDSGGWVLIEANAAWGSGLNGCDAAAVLPCIEAASRLG